jgi:peptide/nickel transport system substrate-binding protein
VAQRGDDPIATPFSTAGWEDIAAIEVNPRGSISVTFARPYAEWEHLFSPLLPAHALVDGAGFNEGLRTLDADTVTAGSFTVEEYVAGDRLVLVGDPDASDPPEFGALDLRFLDSTEAVSAFLAGEIDLAVIDDPSPPDLAEIIEGGEAEVLPASIYEHLTFNLANPLLAEPVVRQAFLAALDRDTVAAAAAAEEGLVTGRVDSRVSTPGRPDYVEGTSNAGADAARAALEGAGFVPGTDGIYARGGQRLSVRLDTTAIPRREAAVDAITALLDEAGIEVLPASSSSIEFFERVLPPDGAVPDFDVAMFASPAPAEQPTSPTSSGPAA